MLPQPALPPQVARTHRNWKCTLLDGYHAATETWRLSHPTLGVRFLKRAPAGVYPSIPDETARTRWAAADLPVPVLLGQGSYGGREWMLTEALPGFDATRPELGLAAEEIVALLAHGLRLFHEAPVEACPFDFQLETALLHVYARAAAGLIVPQRDFHPEHQRLGSVESALAELERLRPADEDPVVCHGDYCFPNVLIDDHTVAGFIDLGELGVAGRWWDLATATWSLEWNLGTGWDALFLETYGAEPDPPRQAFYRLLYDLVS
jgi:aminoglycoside phosphotransferase